MISREVDAQEKILSFSGATWQKIFSDAEARRLIALSDERKALSVAMKLPLRIPNPVQCKMLLNLLDRLEENGLTYVPDAEP